MTPPFTDPGVVALLKALSPHGDAEAQAQHARAVVQAQRLPQLLCCAHSFEELALRLVDVMRGPDEAKAYLIDINRQISGVIEELLLCVHEVSPE